jgi:hypothetical protein
MVKSDLDSDVHEVHKKPPFGAIYGEDVNSLHMRREDSLCTKHII